MHTASWRVLVTVTLPFSTQTRRSGSASSRNGGVGVVYFPYAVFAVFI